PCDTDTNPRRPMPRPRRSLTITGTVPASTDTDPVHLATDAAIDPVRMAGGYLATSGHFGIRAHPYGHAMSGPDRTTVGELRAILTALEVVTRAVGVHRKILVQTDSTRALAYLNRWQRGHTWMPEGYDTAQRSDGRPPALILLQQIAEYTPNLIFTHVKAHAGHPLNECADSLAKLGLRVSKGMLDAASARELAPTWAAANLARHDAPAQR
ncbi:RNase H family protein, partial [Streptomyces sp. CAU 1734]|uniref:RNase H family protein n=1 Tax=Streptomyces sp. CAU 1734 TaxID=3140360 RepID=UPI00326024E6